jgi:adenylate cyclase
MVRHVFENKGSLDKFIGDAILAIWGNVRSEGAAHDVELAITTALRMLRSLRELNVQWRTRGMVEFSMGIGINYGDAIFGNIGSVEKMEPTVIGDPVNLASRLEGLTKEYGQQLCVGENAADLVRDKFHFQLVDYVQVKGKTKPINVYTVLGSCDEPLPVETTQYLQSYEAALQCYREGKFQQAVELFSICLDVRKGDFLAAMYLERCEDLKRNSPETWDGVFVMTRK